MPGLGFLKKFFGNSVSNAAGYAVGGAIESTLVPLLRDLENVTWSENAHMPPSAYEMAKGVAQGQVTEGDAAAWALQTGHNKDVFDALVNVANVGMPLGNAYDAWRRGLLSDTEFTTQLKRSAIEEQWYDAMRGLHDHLLSPQELAVMVQRGIVPDDGLLPVGPPSATGKVPPMPQISVDPVQEAEKQGWIKERLAGLARIIGLPASPDLAARMVFRGIIDRVDFDRAISEGNTRNEWAPFLFEGFREIPTSHDYIEARVRGWIDDAAMYAGTAKHGLSQADTDLRHNILGRPLSFHQVFIGTRRGGKYDGGSAAIDPAFLKSLEESNIRPEWYDLAWAQRFVYPSAFVLRNLTQTGEISEQDAEQVLLFEGWEPTFAAKVAAAWAAPKASATATWDSKAATQLWGATHKSFVAEESDETTARAKLAELGVSAADQNTVIKTWTSERDLIRKQLSPAQIKKSYAEGALNPATGQKWTQADALAALLARGYDQADATTLLEL